MTVYWFAEQIRRMADQISCMCEIHQRMKKDLYKIADRAEKLFLDPKHQPRIKV